MPLLPASTESATEGCDWPIWTHQQTQNVQVARGTHRVAADDLARRYKQLL
jgi:quercetin dioxygenase-like cupin family protein